MRCADRTRISRACLLALDGLRRAAADIETPTDRATALDQQFLHLVGVGAAEDHDAEIEGGGVVDHRMDPPDIHRVHGERRDRGGQKRSCYPQRFCYINQAISRL